MPSSLKNHKTIHGRREAFSESSRIEGKLARTLFAKLEAGMLPQGLAAGAGEAKILAFPPIPASIQTPPEARRGKAGDQPPSTVSSPRKKAFLGKIGKISRAFLLCIVLAHLGYIFTTALLIASYRKIDPSVTVLMVYRKWGYGWKLTAPRPIKLKKVPTYIKNMLVSVEDHKFYDHHGLDFEAFERALEVNARLKRPLYGGSTLTMQVARTLFLVPVKSYLRKYLEVIAALELELLLPKDRILELYFGYAEWGKGIFGIEAAANAYYRRSLSKLTRDDAIRLITLLSSPIKYKPATLERSGILRARYAFLTQRYSSQ